MDIKDCIKFTNGNVLCYFETIDEDQPRIRAMSSWFSDETGFYFQTIDIQSVYEHLQKNPKTEICFYKQESMTGSILRISGEVEFLRDLKLDEKSGFNKIEMKNFGKMIDSSGLIIFRIAHGIANFLTMENNLKPKESINF
jgi:pyridoxamine 5'-phosphate oxidase